MSMIIKLAPCLLIIAFYMALTSYVKPQAISYNYESFAKYADKVVRGKIVASRNVNAYRGSRELKCGILMDIEVIESFRGGTENFLLYSTNSDLIMEDKEGEKPWEYLIFSFKNKFYNREGGANEFVLCEGEDSATKNIAPFEYMNDSQIQRMFPIRVEDRTNKEWMLIMLRNTNVELPITIERHSTSGQNINIIEEMSLEQFQNVILNQK